MKNMNRPAPLCGVSCKLTRRPCKTVQSTHPRGVRHLFEHGHQLRQIISTHAPREGCDRRSRGRTTEGAGFQSTHPARGATASSSQRLRQAGDFNPRTPRGVRPASSSPSGGGRDFNPRTPRGVRHADAVATLTSLVFNPRTPRGVRPLRGGVLHIGAVFSIHAPREGCDAG